jgi:DNA-binding transcriptional ArsR family regulator
MANRLVSVIGMIRPILASISETSGLSATSGGQGRLSPCLQPVTLIWKQNSMATAILKMKKPTKSALGLNDNPLRTKTFQRAAYLLKQVSDPTRLQVITLLSEREHHVGGLCDQFSVSQPVVSRHLALLRHGGIVERRRQGKNNFYTLTDTGYRLSKIIKGVID